MSKDNSSLLIGAALIIGAVMYSRNAAAQIAARPAAQPLPGSAGTGVGQVLGGALGSFLQNLTKGGAQQGQTPQSIASMNSFFSQFNSATFKPTPLPDYQAAYQANPELLDNMMQYGI